MSSDKQTLQEPQSASRVRVQEPAMKRPIFAARGCEQIGGKKGRFGTGGFGDRRRKLMRRQDRGIFGREWEMLRRSDALHEMRDRRVYFGEFGEEFWAWESWW